MNRLIRQVSITRYINKKMKYTNHIVKQRIVWNGTYYELREESLEDLVTLGLSGTKNVVSDLTRRQSPTYQTKIATTTEKTGAERARN
jgi:hypothetical protein